MLKASGQTGQLGMNVWNHIHIPVEKDVKQEQEIALEKEFTINSIVTAKKWSTIVRTPTVKQLLLPVSVWKWQTRVKYLYLDKR